MPRIALTDLTIRNLDIPDKGQRIYYDANLVAFGVRVSQGGAKTFIVNTGPRAKRTQHVIGRYPETSLSQARAQARKIQSLPNSPLNSTPPVTFAEALETYYATHCLKNGEPHRREVKRLLDRHFRPSLQSSPLPTIAVSDITTIIDPLVVPTPVLAAAAYKNIKTFFNWCIKRGYISTSPCSSLDRPTNPLPRDRVLSTQELRSVYLAAVELGYPLGFIALICIHLLARRGEIVKLRWENVTADTIRFPPNITKNGREHVLPNLMAENLNLIPRRGDLLFPSEVGTPFSAWSKNKIKLNRLCGFSDFTLHDLRRTMATFMAEHTEPHIIELILNHASPASLGGPVARIYNRNKYAPQIKAALQRQEEFIAHLIAG